MNYFIKICLTMIVSITLGLCLASVLSRNVARQTPYQDCRLTVEYPNGQVSANSSVAFVVASRSPTRFQSFWPDQPGTVEIPSVTKIKSDSGENVEVRELLDVRFEKVDGAIKPVSYSYEREGSFLGTPLTIGSAGSTCPVLKIATGGE